VPFNVGLSSLAYLGATLVYVALPHSFKASSLGSVVAALAPDLSLLLVGRLIIGVGIGVASMLTPLYLAETAPARTRGALVSLNQLAITCGILVSYLVGYVFAASGEWRWMLGLGAVPGVVLAAGMLVLPESPRWLAGHARLDEAMAVLRRLRGTSDVVVNVIDGTRRSVIGSTVTEIIFMSFPTRSPSCVCTFSKFAVIAGQMPVQVVNIKLIRTVLPFSRSSKK